MQVEQGNVNDLPVLIPVLLLLPSSDASIRKALADAGTIESLILKVCGTRVGITYTPEQMTCRSQPITGEDWERAISHLYNYEVTLYRPGEETPQSGSYNVPRGALSKLQLVDAFEHVLRYTFAGGRVIDTTLERFQRCQHAVSTAGDSDDGENAADIIQNCTDIQRLDGREPTPAELRNIQSRQLAYLQEVDPRVKVIVQQYCDADLLRAPGHFDQNPSQIRRVHRIYVEMCQEWFLGSEYAAVRARWQASYEADQAWEKRFYAPPRLRTVVNGAIQVHVPKDAGS